MLVPASAFAQDTDTVVRVGWYESPFNETDDLGRRSGYAYEYQQKIAAYTGWTYEYVNGSWPDLLQMLVSGKIDLLSDVSYTDERAETMLFPATPMGAEEYFIFIAPGNKEISQNDYSTLNGKKVGIDKGSVQIGFFGEWANANDVKAEIVELTSPFEESLAMLNRGELDAFVTLDQYCDETNLLMPVCKIGSSDIFFAVSASHPELLTELNVALSRIQTEDKYYNMQLADKYFSTSGTNLRLSAEELSWLDGHGTIRVGYQDNYLAFCAQDSATGELTGALKDYLRMASSCLENAHLDFDAKAYPTAEAAIDAMKNGEVDCVFPVNLTDYDGESQGLLITPALMSTDMSAVVRESDLETFANKDRVTVAVNAGNPNYDMFLLDNFPDWQPIYYKDTPTCLQAIADGQADCLLISNYRFNNIAEQCEKYHLTTFATGVGMGYYLAVNRGEKQLYSILNKAIDMVPDSAVNAALSYYYAEDAKPSAVDVLSKNLGVVAVVAVVVLALLAYFLLRSLRSEKKAREERQIISATETDALTGLYNKSFFYEYAHQMRLDHPEKPMDAIVLNIEQFHSVNAVNGHVFGDRVLTALGEEIHAFLAKTDGIAGRAEADHFAIFCSHPQDYQGLLDQLQNKMDKLSSNASIRLRMGVMPWQKDLDTSQQIEQALIACNTARGHFEKHLIVVDDAFREREAYEQRLINDLPRALEQREFVVHYQPKYDIQTEQPTLKSLEALVRWRHPDLGMIPPGDFIPLFENSGQIGEVDKYVWAETARQVASWKKAYAVTIPVSVNLSRVDVFDPALEKTLDTLLAEYGLDCGDLKLEVTESACAESPFQIVDVIERLRRKGYEIEMDDFGAGYSSLSMLSSMPIDVLKMDRAFISNIEHGKKDIQLVELIIGIAKNLKIPVIAEGVETEAQLRLLKDMGCDLVQGFYFSRPLPADEIEKAFLS